VKPGAWIFSRFRFLVCACLILVALNIVAEGSGEELLTGAGATFPHPLYRKWIEVYERESGVRVSYQAVGSGAGIRGFLNAEVDFGASDAILSRNEISQAPGEVLHIPTCVGAIAVVYNLPGEVSLKLTPQLLADIFSGRIVSWADRRITRVNGDSDLPDFEINVVHRSDGSGTTYLFSDYLCRVSPIWRSNVGRGKIVAWPTGLGVEKNGGIAEFVSKIPGSIGYAEMTYAKQHGLPMAQIQNRSGRFIRPDLQSVSAAAQVDIPPNLQVLITDPDTPGSYPVSGFTYLLVYREQAYSGRSRSRAGALVDFLRWALHEGQQYNRELHYARLPEQAVAKAEEVLRTITYGGEPLLEKK
jgi:phosphate transport system substrate-binding protein